MCVWTNLYSMKIIRECGIEFVSERQYLTEDFFFNIQLKNLNNIIMEGKVIGEIGIVNSVISKKIDKKGNIVFAEIDVEELWVTGDVRPGRSAEKWLNLILRKRP